MSLLEYIKVVMVTSWHSDEEYYNTMYCGQLSRKNVNFSSCLP